MEQSSLPTTVSSVSASHSSSKIIIICLSILFIASLAANVIIFRNLSSRISKSQVVPLDKPNSLFDSQTASLRGKIIQQNGNVITIENTEKGVQGELPLAQNFKTLTLGGNPTAAPSKEIQLNQEALFDLLPINNQFEVSIITYIPSNPALPNPETQTPIASQVPAPDPTDTLSAQDEE